MTSRSPLVEGELNVAGVRTRTLSVAGDGPPVLLLHGYTDSADTWRYVLKELADSGRAGIAVDLPGHGRATAQTRGPMLPQLKAFASALAEQHPDSVMAGNSLGGLSALLAAEDPDVPLAGVVAISPAGLGYQRWFLAMKSLIAPAMFASRALPPAAARPFVAGFYARVAVSEPPPVEALDRYASHFYSTKRIRGLLSMVDRLKSEALDGCIDLGAVHPPFQLVWGTKDWLVPVPSIEQLESHRPGTELVVWPGYGHCPQLEAPYKVAQQLIDFADR
jgi:pimeloyl-ACP methyl ester carboxylesterase